MILRSSQSLLFLTWSNSNEKFAEKTCIKYHKKIYAINAIESLEFEKDPAKSQSRKTTNLSLCQPVELEDADLTVMSNDHQYHLIL